MGTNGSLAARVVAAGCVSLFVATVPTAAAQSSVGTYAATADSYVQAAKPRATAGTATKLRIDGSPVIRSYVRFDVQGLWDPVRKATLRFYATSSSSRPFEVRAVSDNTWGEATLTHNNAPPFASTATATSTSFSSRQWVALDVTPLVAGNGLVSAALTTASSTEIGLAAREQGTAYAPQLVVETAPAAPLAVAPANSSPPTVSGTAEEGRPLSAAPGTWSGTEPMAYVYQWRRCGQDGSGCADVAGSTATTYSLTAADVGSTVRVRVTASNQAGSAVADSAPTQTVARAPVAPSNTSLPTVSGTAQEGEQLAAAPGTWSGTEPIAHAYQWRRCDDSGSGCSDVAGATATTYSLTGSDVGSTLRVRVTASNQAGSAAADSAPTGTVAQAPVAPPPPPPPPTVADPVVAAAGDIACDPADASFNSGLGTATACRQLATSDLLVGGGLAAVLTLGDNQYECSGLSSYQASYDPSWGRVKAITHPTAGNHEYTAGPGSDCDSTGHADGYFSYFGAAAGDPGKGYYSFDVGSWHLIALNSNCSKVGGCGAGSPQETWLRQDLAAAGADCVLAYWHHPLFSSGRYRPGVAAVKPLFQALYDHRADVVLAGHDHNYERFAPQNPEGGLDLENGIRHFIVGTGGKNGSTVTGASPNSEVRGGAAFGVIKLTLSAGGFSWRFVSDANAVIDSGSDTCAGTPPDTAPPAAPSKLSVGPVGSSSVDLTWSPAADDVGAIGYDIYRDGALLKRTDAAVTTYSDTAVAPSTTYTYEVRARDAAGNVSPASGSATATTLTPNVSVFAAEADARVAEAAPATNYGTSYLRIDGGADPDVDSYLRFTVSLGGRPVQSAKLRLYAITDASKGPVVHPTSNTWTESTITWNTRPAPTGPATADIGAVPANAWVELDVTPSVTGDGTYSFRLTTPSTDGLNMNAREASASRPQLVVTTG